MHVTLCTVTVYATLPRCRRAVIFRGVQFLHNFSIKSRTLWAGTRVWSRATAMLSPGVHVENYECLVFSPTRWSLVWPGMSFSATTAACMFLLQSGTLNTYWVWSGRGKPSSTEQNKNRKICSRKNCTPRKITALWYTSWFNTLVNLT